MITNETPDGDGGTIFWILPYANLVPGEVELEDLMRDNGIITGATPMGGGPDHLSPERLDPQDKWFNDDPTSDDTTSAVFWFKIYEDVIVDGEHTPGAQIGTTMDATVTGLVPEPTTLGVLTLGTLALLRRYRRG